MRFFCFSFQGADIENQFSSILASLSQNGPGIGTTCMADFVQNETLASLSAFGAHCAIVPGSTPTDGKYSQGFTQDYPDNVPGKLIHNCGCTTISKHSSEIEWACSPRAEVEVPPRNLMETKDVLFNLTSLNLVDMDINGWILGAYMSFSNFINKL